MEQQTVTEELFETENEITLTGGPMGALGSVTITNLPVNKIKIGKNSRTDIRDEELSGLMQSIKETGLLQPIGVIKKNSGYEVCYGNRRFLASSKLGHKKIPAIIHKDKSEAEIDIKNLTENVQRRNISLRETGRYIDILEKQGLTRAEIGVRLGVSKDFVTACLSAYKDTPEEFRKDLAISTVKTTKREPGKIALSTAAKIINVAKTYRLNAEQKKILFKEAKTNSSFDSSTPSIRKYAARAKAGSKTPVADVAKIIHVKHQFFITEKHRDDLIQKYIDEGPFKTMSQLFNAILKGEKNVRIEVL